jgi:hypothetical protein
VCLQGLYKLYSLHAILSPSYNFSRPRSHTLTRLTPPPPKQSLFPFNSLMSNKGPNIYGRSPKLLMNGNTSLNAAASSYVPGSRTQNNTISQVSLHLAPQLDSRVSKLEEGHSGLREKVDSLTELYNDLCSSVDKIKQGGWPVTVGSFQEQDPDQSDSSSISLAARFISQWTVLLTLRSSTRWQLQRPAAACLPICEWQAEQALTQALNRIHLICDLRTVRA